MEKNLIVTDAMVADLVGEARSSESDSHNESMASDEAKILLSQNVYDGSFGAQIERPEQCWLQVS